jgi:hypothetical protein
MSTTRKQRVDRPKSRRGKGVLDARLDLALAETFPASDPIAIGGATSTEPPARPVDRMSPLLDLDAMNAAQRG